MTDAVEVQDTVDPLPGDGSIDTVTNNGPVDGPSESTENPIKETLVSDISRENFRDEFEFSVAVEPKPSPENGQFEREITITRNQTTSAVDAEPEVETVLQRLVNASPAAANLTIIEDRESSLLMLPTDSVAPDGVTITTMPEESVKHEVLDSSPEVKSVSEEADTSPEQPTDRPSTDLIPAQHGPSAAEVIRATPESVLVVSSEAPSEPRMSPPQSPVVTRKTPGPATPVPESVVHEGHPQSRTSTLTGSEDVSSNGPLPKPGSSSAATEEMTRSKKKMLFNFKLRPFKKAKSEAQPPLKSHAGVEIDETTEKSAVVSVSGDSTGQHKFTDNVKKAFGNLKRTMSLHHKSGVTRGHHVRPVSRPARPPPPWRGDRSIESGLKRHSSLKELNQASLDSVSRPSLPGSPLLSKRQRPLQRTTYFGKVMPSEMISTEVRSEDEILGRVAASIAHPPPQLINEASEGSVHEDRIQPIQVKRPTSIGGETPGGDGLRTASCGAGLPPKPPRPQSPPLLSPLDYQHFNDTPGQQDLTTQRMALLNEMNPSIESGSIRARSVVQVKRPQFQSRSEGKTGSVDYSREADYPPESPATIRRAQTLRTDYASLVRERVRSLRVEPSSEGTEIAPVRPLKPRMKSEKYMCTETIKLPKFNLKLKSRQTVPPKTVHASSGKDKSTEAAQPHARITSFYHPVYGRRGSPESDMHSDYVMNNQVGVLQSTPPMPRRQVHSSMQNGIPDAKFQQAGRQVTSLHSVSMSPASLQQQTYLMDAPGRGLYLNYPPTVQTTQEIKSLRMPFFTENLLSDSEAENSADNTNLATAVRKFQTFLSDWDQLSPKTITEAADEQSAERRTRNALADYLKVCVRLRSVDLEGQFAPFHYPLASFDLKHWPKFGQLSDWARLLILQQPNAETAYVYLDPAHAKEEKFTYSDRPLDTMLTNWLDCHHTIPPVTDLQRSAAQPAQTAILHPILFASTLNQVLGCKPYNEDSRNQLLNTCFLLAALLSYTDCRALLVSQHPDGKPMRLDVNNALLVVSAVNCLVLFRYGPVPESDAHPTEPAPDQNSDIDNHQRNGEEGSDILAKLDTGTDKSAVKQAIDDLIAKIHQHTFECVQKTDGLPNLMNCLTPPDWIAMMLARIVMSKCP